MKPRCQWPRRRSGAFMTPGSGMGKKIRTRIRDPDPWWTTRIIFPSELRHNFFGLKYLNSLMRIRDGKNSDPGWKKFGFGTNIPDPQHRLQTYLVINGRGGEGAEAEAELGASAQPVAALHNARHVEGEDEHECACAVTRVADPHSFHPEPDPAF